MANEKRTFVFNVAWAEVLSGYDAEVRLEVYDAVIKYAASGTLPELKPLANMAFSFIKNDIDHSQAKYEETVKKRSEAGRKGMESRYGKGVPKEVRPDAPEEARPETPQEKLHEGPEEARQAASDGNTDKYLTKITSANKTNKANKANLYVYDNDYDYENNNVVLNGSFSDEKDLKKPPTDFSRLPPPSPDFFSEVLVYWNDAVKKSGSLMRPITKVTDKRKKTIMARLRENNGDRHLVFTVIDKAVASSFLNGNNKRAYVGTFDALFAPGMFQKALEGNYDDIKPFAMRQETIPLPPPSADVEPDKTREERDNETRQRFIRMVRADKEKPNGLMHGALLRAYEAGLLKKLGIEWTP